MVRGIYCSAKPQETTRHDIAQNSLWGSNWNNGKYDKNEAIGITENTLETRVCGIILVPQLSIIIVKSYCPPLWLRNHVDSPVLHYDCGALTVESYWFFYSKFCFGSTIIVEPYWFLSPPLWLWNHIGSSVLQGYIFQIQCWLWDN